MVRLLARASAIPTALVFEVGHHLEVIGVDAEAPVAAVIDLLAGRQRAVDQDEHRDVNGDRSAVETHARVVLATAGRA
ncbi:hypothetical protein ACSSVZ_002932 [Amorphus sp. MBR-141]